MDYSTLLREHDDPVHWEWPPDFDYQSAESDFYDLVADLESRLSTKLVAESGGHIQDASFRGQVFLPATTEGNIILRCSNFGRMAAISDESCLAQPVRNIVLAVLAEHCYVFIPEAELLKPYTGHNPGVTGISSWWERYFDWI